MLVHNKTMKVNPSVDELFTLKNGTLTSDVSNGKIEWSNELVAHVVELKTNGPVSTLEDLENDFLQNIKEINKLLENLDSKLFVD